MPVYRILTVATVLLLAVIGLAYAVGSSKPVSAPGAETASPAGPTADGSPSAAATFAPTRGNGAGKGAGSSPGGQSAEPGTPDGGAAAGGAGSSAGVEMPTGNADSGYKLPAHSAGPGASPPLLDGALPQAASGQAALVSGFPAKVVPVAPRSQVSTNSISPSGDLLQVSLVATRDRGADALLRFYRARLSGLGFSEKPAHAVSGSTAAAFERGRSSVVVTVTPAQPMTYSVFAILAAGAS